MRAPYAAKPTTPLITGHGLRPQPLTVNPSLPALRQTLLSPEIVTSAIQLGGMLCYQKLKDWVSRGIKELYRDDPLATYMVSQEVKGVLKAALTPVFDGAAKRFDPTAVIKL